MKKILTFMLLISMILTFTACADNGSEKPGKNTPNITVQEVYNAGKDLNALLGNHENVYIVATSNGKVISEEYFSKEIAYTFYDAEYLDIGIDNSSCATDHSEYVCIDNNYARSVILDKNGIVDIKEYFALTGTSSFLSSMLLNDDGATIVEKNGTIIVTCTAGEDYLSEIGYENIKSCVETYTLDAKTHEMTAINTVYTFNDGTKEEGILTITRDVEIPEGMKEFVKFENETENLRTITIVSNPGTDNEKTETVQIAKGLQISLSPDFMIEDTFTMYADAACTQVIEEDTDVNSDLTVYIKWN